MQEKCFNKSLFDLRKLNISGQEKEIEKKEKEIKQSQVVTQEQNLILSFRNQEYFFNVSVNININIFNFFLVKILLKSDINSLNHSIKTFNMIYKEGVKMLN